MSQAPDCIFCKIIAGQIPAKKIYEDEDFIAFHDINPKAPVHILVIPRQHIVSLLEVDETHQQLLGRMLLLAPRIARENGCSDGFRVSINNGRSGGQEVYHLHMHLLGFQQ
jgi:histidine triad (HIT) family protein